MQPTPQQLSTALVTTTLFESIGLFIGAVLVSFSAAFQLPVLGFIALAGWFMAFWAENYSVAEIVVPRLNLSRTVCVFVMSVAEFVTWTIWLWLVLQFNLHWIVGLVSLIILTHVHHTIQLYFFFQDSTFLGWARHPILFAGSVIEAIAGQWLVIQVVQTTPQQMDVSTLILPLIGIILVIGTEHIVAGQAKPVYA